MCDVLPSTYHRLSSPNEGLFHQRTKTKNSADVITNGQLGGMAKFPHHVYVIFTFFLTDLKLCYLCKPLSTLESFASNLYRIDGHTPKFARHLASATGTPGISVCLTPRRQIRTHNHRNVVECLPRHWFDHHKHQPSLFQTHLRVLPRRWLSFPKNLSRIDLLHHPPLPSCTKLSTEVKE